MGDDAFAGRIRAAAVLSVMGRAVARVRPGGSFHRGSRELIRCTVVSFAELLDVRNSQYQHNQLPDFNP
ncbi:hypothetical protein [Nannocystis radixulma]|uniref:Uncharacterized protein n=1 Tax=Nannocystis radixulma TaxID=2995305 RepID=A0ABT5B0Q3_9BACT|nr:hypothetical protein [Nannocystis radixulma]MDC0667681.1 hypothetical protein [Nannocystis radixulma]